MDAVSQIAAMGEHTSEMSTANLLMSILVISFAIVLPALVVAVAILKSPTTRPDDEIGLGSVSLHDEMWDFVSAVEKGDVTLASLEAADKDPSEQSLGSSRGPVVS